MSSQVAARFQAGVVRHLEPLSSQLVPVLKRLVAYPFAAQVHHLDFEVFCDGFTAGFPVRAFFMDADNCEYFVCVEGKARYPCDVDPELLKIGKVYSREFEEEFTRQDVDLDCFTLAGEALIPWFGQCWTAAGGQLFDRGACIVLHDDSRRYDLLRQKWTQ